MTELLLSLRAWYAGRQLTWKERELVVVRRQRRDLDAQMRYLERDVANTRMALAILRGEARP